MYINDYLKKSEKEEENILLIGNSYRYWKEMLFEKCVRIFQWSGLPFPQKEIETRLMLQGYCGFVKDGKTGLMVASGGMSGTTQYSDEFKNFTYSAPTAKGGTVGIDKQCVIIDNTTLRNPLFPMIERYASLLAHADISIKMGLINLRHTNTYSSKDEGTADSIKAMQKERYRGKDAVIVDSDNISKDTVINLTPQTSGNNGIMDCIDARNELLRSFFNEIGIKYNRDKKERMIESEVSNDNQYLLFNINDMLKVRKSACEKINNLFNLTVSVELSEEFKIIEQEENANDKVE